MMNLEHARSGSLASQTFHALRKVWLYETNRSPGSPGTEATHNALIYLLRQKAGIRVLTHVYIFIRSYLHS